MYATQLGGQMEPTGKMIKRLLEEKMKSDYGGDWLMVDHDLDRRSHWW